MDLFTFRTQSPPKTFSKRTTAKSFQAPTNVFGNALGLFSLIPSLNYAAEKKQQQPNAPTTATTANADKSRVVKRPRNTNDEIDSIFVGNLAREVSQEVLQV